MIVPSMIAALVLLAIVPPYKLSASPSFMALSVLFSIILFILIRKLDDLKEGAAFSLVGSIEYLGTKPIRYWVMMWLLIIIPTAFYIVETGKGFPLGFSTIQAIIIAFGCLVLLYILSRVIDLLIDSYKKRFIVKK
jgi:hypothetical protein